MGFNLYGTLESRMLFLIAMTKVQATFKLSRPLTDDDLKSIARMHAVYGFLAVRLSSSGQELFVEYDFSRLSEKEARGSLQQNGIPVV
jgi:hypothetical protein